MVHMLFMLQVRLQNTHAHDACVAGRIVENMSRGYHLIWIWRVQW